MTLILGALDGEIVRIVSGIEGRSATEWNEYIIHEGTIAGKPVVLARTGVGKSLAAMLCQHLVDVYHPERILFTGVAGAINPDLRIGDTLVARDCVMHDMDATSLGFKRGEIPYTPYCAIPCDPALVATASEIDPLKGTVRIGRVLTGDQFIASSETRDELREALDGDAAEMEGASVGLVAAINRIPFLLIRTISDQANGKAHIDFTAFLEFASENSWHYLEQIIPRL